MRVLYEISSNFKFAFIIWSKKNLASSKRWLLLMRVEYEISLGFKFGKSIFLLILVFVLLKMGYLEEAKQVLGALLDLV